MEGEQPFGRWVRQLRKELDLTQEQLADQIGCSVETIHKVESGQRRLSRPLAERLARFLELTPEEQAPFVEAARAQPALAPGAGMEERQSEGSREEPGTPGRLPQPPQRLATRFSTAAQCAIRPTSSGVRAKSRF